MKKIDFKDVNFILKTLIYTGIPGFLYLGISLGVKSFFTTTINPVFIIFSIELMCGFAYGYLIYLLLKGRQISIKEILYIILITPFIFWSSLGHLGTSDALSVFFGNSFGSIYMLVIMCLYIYVIVKKLKTFKK